jgi:hypothetical protein
MTVVSDYERAWLAGIVDGEGCITATNTTSILGAQPRFAVGMSHELTIRRLHRLFGVGSVIVCKPRKVSPKIHYRWQSSAQEAAGAIRLVLKYLVTKRREALLLLQLADMKRGTSGRRLSPAMRAKQQRLVAALKKEKH